MHFSLLDLAETTFHFFRSIFILYSPSLSLFLSLYACRMAASRGTARMEDCENEMLPRPCTTKSVLPPAQSHRPANVARFPATQSPSAIASIETVHEGPPPIYRAQQEDVESDTQKECDCERTKKGTSIFVQRNVITRITGLLFTIISLLATGVGLKLSDSKNPLTAEQLIGAAIAHLSNSTLS